MDYHPWLRLFQDQKKTLDAIGVRLREQLQKILPSDPLHIQSLTVRVKEEASLREKLRRPDATYGRLLDITDLIGIRVVTYFEDSILDIAKLIEAEFAIDFDHSVDKRQHSDASQFGYRSLHYICALDPGLAHDLPQNLQGMKFEIQIRTVLQHAWAEIEHDLGYKSPLGLPPRMRRKFSQIASLLEIADEEFVKIKSEIALYQEKLRLSQGMDPTFLMNQFSLEAFLLNPVIGEVDQAVAKKLGLPLVEDTFFPHYLLKCFEFLDAPNIRVLQSKLSQHKTLLLDFLDPYFAFTEEGFGFSFRDLDQIRRGYSLLILAHILLLEKKSLALERIDYVSQFFMEVDQLQDAPKARRLAQIFCQKCSF